MRHLGGEEDVGARNAGRTQGLGDARLRAVFARGVDMAVAAAQGGGDDLAALRAQAAGAEPDGGNFGAVGAKHRHGGHVVSCGKAS